MSVSGNFVSGSSSGVGGAVSRRLDTHSADDLFGTDTSHTTSHSNLSSKFGTLTITANSDENTNNNSSNSNSSCSSSSIGNSSSASAATLFGTDTSDASLWSHTTFPTSSVNNINSSNSSTSASNWSFDTWNNPHIPVAPAFLNYPGVSFDNATHPTNNTTKPNEKKKIALKVLNIEGCRKIDSSTIEKIARTYLNLVVICTQVKQCNKIKKST